MGRGRRSPQTSPLVKLARDTTKDVKKNKELLGAYTRFAKTGDWKIPKRKSRGSAPKKGGSEEPKQKAPEPKTAFNLDGYDYDFLTPIQVQIMMILSLLGHML